MEMSQRRNQRLIVTLHTENGVKERPIDNVESVSIDPRGTRVETDKETHYFRSDEYEKVVTEWEDIKEPHRLIEEYE